MSKVSLVEGTFTLSYDGWVLVVSKITVQAQNVGFMHVSCNAQSNKKTKSCTKGFPLWCAHMNC